MVVSEVYEAAPLSYMTRVAEDMLIRIMDETVFVPVTTRTQAQFARVQLPGRGHSYAVTTNGAVLLHHGKVDPDWTRHVALSLAGSCAPLQEVRDRLNGRWALPGILRVRTAEDMFVYSIVNREELSDDYLEDLAAWCGERGWATSLQGRKLYCMPNAITKEAAVAEVRRRIGAAMLIAAGDSRLDAGLLELADIAIRPAHGELETAGFHRPNLTVTSVSGVLAGEEILGIVSGILAETAAQPCALRSVARA
ncbi:HAD family hydrolase [Arthrobacter sp. NPDC080031]|uniref:HAD family hydrolase n=1 Tax=Arthrobacter sp. NPDC080031 TaxID=3155918 RepID=UPI00344C635C